MRAINKVLIANRGEIAVRIIRTLKMLGMQTVAIYSAEDAYCLHRFFADEAVFLGKGELAQTYLDAAKIVAIAKKVGADAIHPGLGFLAENAFFAEQTTISGLKFIGPSAQVIATMGDKIKAHKVAEEANIPVLSGCREPLASLEELEFWAQKIGYPIILKAARGGGGKGQRVVYEKKDLAEAFSSCKREALAYFASDDVFCEKFLEKPKHIEIQVLFDEHGHGIHLGERDCSIQRKQQKLFEESPSPFLNEAQREHIGALAVRLAAHAGYQGLGTVEFIIEDPSQPYFMEMNTRLQVEHPVTEMVTGLDLVREQIKVASGLPLDMRAPKLNGWSMEARINSEDPRFDFRPTSGRVAKLAWPGGPFVRVDSHLYQGYAIPSSFDSLLAKLIVWAPSREDCLARLSSALEEMRIKGVWTNQSFHRALLMHEGFRQGHFSTAFLREEQSYFEKVADEPSAGHVNRDLAAISAASRQLGV